MRVLLACEYYHPSRGGVQEVSRQLAERLVERGHEVTVATTYMAERRERTVRGVRIKEFRISGNAVNGVVGDADAYRRHVLEGEYDLLMINAAQQWTLDALEPVLDRIKIPKLLIPCGFSRLYDPAFRSYYDRMPGTLRAFDHLVFNASAYRDIDFARERGITHFSIVPNGASEREFLVPRDPNFRLRHGIPDDAFVVMTVGSLTGQKGHRELAMAFKEARFPGRIGVLMLNGNVPTSSSTLVNIPRQILHHLRTGSVRSLTARAARVALTMASSNRSPSRNTDVPLLRLTERIQRSRSDIRIMVVDLPRTELVQAYLNSDLFAFASWIEYSPLVLYEAAAAGLPFLSVPVGNAEEIARLTGAGEICPAPRDVHGYTRVEPRVLAEGLSRMAADRSALRAYSEAGRRNWLERYTWERITERYEEILSRLVSGSAGNVEARSRSSDVRPARSD